MLCHRPGDHRLPKPPSPGRVGDAILDPLSIIAGELGQAAIRCRNGRLNARPKPLGLSRAVDARSLRNLAAPIYAKATPQERVLEEEAYANQDNLTLGWQLLQAHCGNR